MSWLQTHLFNYWLVICKDGSRASANLTHVQLHFGSPGNGPSILSTAVGTLLVVTLNSSFSCSPSIIPSLPVPLHLSNPRMPDLFMDHCINFPAFFILSPLPTGDSSHSTNLKMSSHTQSQNSSGLLAGCLTRATILRNSDKNSQMTLCHPSHLREPAWTFALARLYYSYPEQDREHSQLCKNLMSCTTISFRGNHCSGLSFKKSVLFLWVIIFIGS